MIMIIIINANIFREDHQALDHTQPSSPRSHTAIKPSTTHNQCWYLLQIYLILVRNLQWDTVRYFNFNRQNNLNKRRLSQLNLRYVLLWLLCSCEDVRVNYMKNIWYDHYFYLIPAVYSFPRNSERAPPLSEYGVQASPNVTTRSFQLGRSQGGNIPLPPSALFFLLQPPGAGGCISRSLEKNKQRLQ